jgi:hypothetical protein
MGQVLSAGAKWSEWLLDILWSIDQKNANDECGDRRTHLDPLGKGMTVIANRPTKNGDEITDETTNMRPWAPILVLAMCCWLALCSPLGAQATPEKEAAQEVLEDQAALDEAIGQDAEAEGLGPTGIKGGDVCVVGLMTPRGSETQDHQDRQKILVNVNDTDVKPGSISVGDALTTMQTASQGK